VISSIFDVCSHQPARIVLSHAPTMGEDRSILVAAAFDDASTGTGGGPSVVLVPSPSLHHRSFFAHPWNVRCIRPAPCGGATTPRARTENRSRGSSGIAEGVSGVGQYPALLCRPTQVIPPMIIDHSLSRRSNVHARHHCLAPSCPLRTGNWTTDWDILCSRPPQSSPPRAARQCMLLRCGRRVLGSRHLSQER
jgi:hypothetical protein